MFDNLIKFHGSFQNDQKPSFKRRRWSVQKVMVLPERQQGKSSREAEHSSKTIQDQHDCSPGTDERNSPVPWCNGGELAVGVPHMTKMKFLFPHIGEQSRQIVRSIDQQCW